ncbi:TPA: colicin E1 family microcin immunity protein [Serratia fonticola]
MTWSYYLKNIFWGLFYTSAVCSAWYKNPESERLTVILTLSGISCFLFPFSKKLIEIIALKYSTKEFWQQDFFVSSVGGSVQVIYDLFCLVFAVPLAILYLFIAIFKALRNKP